MAVIDRMRPASTRLVGTKKYLVVAVGDTFNLGGWLWAVVRVSASGKTYWAKVTAYSTKDGTAGEPVTFERTDKFTAEIGETYWGEADQYDEKEEEE
jgi:hypothetical protein